MGWFKGAAWGGESAGWSKPPAVGGGGPLSVTSLGANADTSSNNTAILASTLAAVADNESIIVGVGNGENDTFSSATDQAGNTYSKNVEGAHASDNVAAILDCLDPASALPIANTITATLSAASIRTGIGALKLNRVAARVVGAAAGGSGDSATPSVTAGASAGAGAVAVGVLQSNSGTAALTEPAGWGVIFNDVTNGRRLLVARKELSGTETVTWNPTIASSQRWAAAVAVYE